MDTLATTLPPGCFVIHGSVKMAALAQCYGWGVNLGAQAEATVSEFIISSRQQASPGDSVSAGPAEFVVIHADGGQVVTAGLRFRATAALRPAVAVPGRRRSRKDSSRHIPLPMPGTVPGRPDHPMNHADHARPAPG